MSEQSLRFFLYFLYYVKEGPMIMKHILFFLINVSLILILFLYLFVSSTID